MYARLRFPASAAAPDIAAETGAVTTAAAAAAAAADKLPSQLQAPPLPPGVAVVSFWAPTQAAPPQEQQQQQQQQRRPPQLATAVRYVDGVEDLSQAALSALHAYCATQSVAQSATHSVATQWSDPHGVFTLEAADSTAVRSASTPASAAVPAHASAPILRARAGPQLRPFAVVSRELVCADGSTLPTSTGTGTDIGTGTSIGTSAGTAADADVDADADDAEDGLSGLLWLSADEVRDFVTGDP
jgi:hypothetical protein